MKVLRKTIMKRFGITKNSPDESPSMSNSCDCINIISQTIKLLNFT